MQDNQPGTIMNSWVTLHLVAQTEGSTMPESVTGILSMETSGAYVLGCMLEEVFDEQEEDWVKKPSAGLNFIHKTYVWRLEVLPGAPDMGGGKAGMDAGGLG